MCLEISQYLAVYLGEDFYYKVFKVFVENLLKVIVLISAWLIDYNHIGNIAANIFRYLLVFVIRVKRVALSFLVYLKV
jgi:hypothetical protein